MKYTLIITLILFTSCQGILDKDPIATLDAGSFFQTADDAIQAINAAYKPLTFSNTNNNVLQYILKLSGKVVLGEAVFYKLSRGILLRLLFLNATEYCEDHVH